MNNWIIAFGFFAALQALKQDEIVQFPETTGSYSVGTESYYFVDRLRYEEYTPDNPNDKRELMVQVWYPANVPEDASRSLWLPDSDILVPEAKIDIPENPDIFWEGCSTIISNSVVDAPLIDSNEQFPVLIYSHAWEYMRTENTYLFEELASHGYVVWSIDHTYHSKAVKFPDGRVLKNLRVGSHPSNVRNQDVQFVRDKLNELNDSQSMNSRFANRLDLDRVGLMGFSAGGGTTIETLKVDDRFKVGLTLDGVDDPTGLNQVIMVLQKKVPSSAGKYYEMFKNKKLQLFGSNIDGYYCEIDGPGHFDFCDLSLVWRLLKLPGKYPRPVSSEDPIRIHRIIADYALAFFDRHLKDKQDVTLLDGPSTAYKEVEFIILKRE